MAVLLIIALAELFDPGSRGPRAPVSAGRIAPLQAAVAPLHVIATVDLPGEAAAVAVAGGFAYLASKGTGARLSVVNLREAAAPRVTGSVAIPDKANDIVVSGDRAYVSHDSGLAVVDVTDSAAPRLLVSSLIYPRPTGVAVADGHAFVADWDRGLWILSVGGAGAPRYVGSVSTTSGYATGVAVAGHHAYLTDWYRGLQVADVSEPTRPRIVAGIDALSYAYDVAVVGRTAYVAGDILSELAPSHPTSRAALATVDVSDPERPRPLGTVEGSDGGSAAVAVLGRYAFLASGYYGLDVIDAQNPRALRHVGTVALGPAWDVAAAGELVLVAGGPDLVVLQVDAPPWNVDLPFGLR